MSYNDLAIKVNNLSKRYRIGLKEELHSSFGAVLIDFIKSPLKNYRKYRSLYKFDDLDQSSRSTPDSLPSDIIWAVRNVSFEVKKGEVIGIVGRNGAGKSTLLKILSRITDPTSGYAEIRGRIASLLEVGTGFHPELTGRENVYLNGTVLGMTKKEIDRKFDEIVDFSGVEKFIDTPVKRYSSGMKVRLAFSVSAHLEPEILLVDEVLAVGDVAFQRKCIGKMQDVARGGRTILFVSHNLSVIENLCSRALLITDGKLAFDGTTKETIDLYSSEISELTNTELSERKDRKGLGEIKITKIDLLNNSNDIIVHPASGQKLIIRMHYKSFVNKVFDNCRVSVAVSRNERPYFNLSTELIDTRSLNLSGEGYLDFIIDRLPLSQSTYNLTSFIEADGIVQDWVEAAAEMYVLDGNFYGTGRNYPKGWAGVGVLLDYEWRVGHADANIKDEPQV